METPATAEAFCADLAFFAVLGFGFPNMNIAHGVRVFEVERMGRVGRIGGVVKEIGKILAYLVAVLILGSFLAPPLYWAGQGLIESGHLVWLKRFGFQKYFNRAVLISAFVLLWPTVQWLRIRSLGEFRMERDEFWRRHLCQGILLGAGVMLVLGGVYSVFGIYVPKGSGVPWGKIGAALGSACVVSVLEETLFRGGIFGLFRRSLSGRGALWATSALFALVHFIKPNPNVRVPEVHWLSGFELLPHSFHQFGQPVLFLGGFLTLLVFGWVLGVAVERTGSLWMSIGIHGGLVFVKLSFERIMQNKGVCLPWVGSELQVGLIPVILLLGLGWAVMRLGRSGSVGGAA